MSSKKLFRFHKGSLEESMQTCVEISDRAGLIDHISKAIDLELSADDILIKAYGYDFRIGWNSYIISLGERGGVLGFSNHPFDN